jgi:hypothetical protein
MTNVKDTLSAPLTASAIATVDGTTDETALTIPEGIYLVIGNTISSITGKINIDGSLTIGSGTANKVTFTKAAITGAAGTTFTGTAGTAAFGAGAILALASDGALETEGTGSAAFGQTTFSGDGGNWTATATGGGATAGVKITSTANGAIIGMTTGVAGQTACALTAGGTNPTITQAAAASNNLTIATGTTIALGGDDSTAVGQIVLKNSGASDANDNGLLTLAAASSVITTGNPSANVAAAPLTNDSSTEVNDASSYTGIGVLLLIGDGSAALLEPTNAPDDGTKSSAGNIVKLIGGTNATIKGGDGSNKTDGTVDGTISGETATEADAL